MYKESGAISTNDLKNIWRRRKWPMMIVSAILIGASVVLSMTLPAVYRSTATIIVQKPEIPEELLSSTVSEYIEYEIDSIKSDVLTSANLLKVARDTGVLVGQPDETELLEIASSMMDAISINYVTNERITDKGRVYIDTLAFTISVDDASPVNSRKIAAEIGGLFIEEAQSGRQERAAVASNFLSKEVDRLGQEVAGYEQKLSDLKQNNVGLLPDSAAYTLQLLDTAQRTLAEQQAAVKELKARQLDLEYRLSSESSANTELSIARAELIAAQQKYSEFHPDIARLKGRVRALEEAGSYGSPDDATGAGSSMSASSDPTATQLRSELSRVKSELGAAQSKLQSTEEKIAGFESRLQKSPEVERRYLALQRDYENSRLKLNELKNKLLDAQITEQLEQGQKATHFELFAPNSDGEQVKPNRKGIVILGAVLSLLAAILVGTLLEQMDTTVRGRSDIISIMHEEPLAVIPDLRFVSTVKDNKLSVSSAASIIVLMTLLVSGGGLLSLLYL
jgi:polysaccharide chain length determinant protein (PEP-CTERM system associated)